MMGFLKRLWGDEGEQNESGRSMQSTTRGNGGTPTDEQAIERYRYLVRTAPPDAIEQAHEKAFAQLTPEQRQLALQELSKTVPASERIERDDPKSLARMATRAELQQPGTVERIFHGRSQAMGGGYGYGGGLFGGGFMSSLAGTFVGSIIAQGLYDSFFDVPENNGGDSGASLGDNGVYEGDLGTDYGSDVGGDFGGDFGGADV